MAAAQISSPRLPSPPPLTEDFIHPKSPISFSEDHGKLESASKVDHGASRRIRPGTRATDIAEGPPVVPLEEIDSSFALTEHLKALHNAAVHPDAHVEQAIDRETAVSLSTPPEGVDKAIWLHELCRFLCQRVNSILIALFADSPPCSSHTCPEMRASEWQYLCAVHDPPKSCCAIDYCCHTLDWAATTLTSVKNFPNYGTSGQLDGSGSQPGQLRQLTNVFRRVYRIFAHAWFQHRDVFWQVEHRTGLYVFFKTVCDVYSLIPEDNYTIPPEAEGLEPEEKGEEVAEQHVLLRRDTAPKEDVGEEKPEALLGSTLAAGNTTKRHRHNPSTGATAVDTVPEENEDEDHAQPNTTIIEQEPDNIKTEDAPSAESEPAALPTEPEPIAETDLKNDVKPEPSASEAPVEAKDETENIPVSESQGDTTTTTEPSVETAEQEPTKQEPTTSTDDQETPATVTEEEGEEATIMIKSEE